MEKNAHVLVDTNVIIEANRLDVWNRLFGSYRLDTVTKCVEECDTGNQRRSNLVPIDTKAIIKILKPKNVIDKQIANLILCCNQAEDLDPGEKHLLSYALTLTDDTYYVCSPDKACMRVAYGLGMLDRFISLEELMRGCGAKVVGLRTNYLKSWLERFKTEIKFESL